MQNVIRGLCASFLFCLLALPAFSQESGPQIQGVVTDTSGAPMPDVSITVTNRDSGVSRSIKTDAQGHYIVTPLDPGAYVVIAEKYG